MPGTLLGYFNSVVSDIGRPIVATITVYDAGTTNLSTIYADDGGSVALANPFVTDALGRFEFYALQSLYDVQISGSGITTYKMENVILGETTLMPGASTQYYRGDKTWQTLNQAAVPGTEPTITAGTRAQYYRGDKTWAAFPGIYAADYGAIGDGSADDTAAIQAAVDVCLAVTPAKPLYLNGLHRLVNHVHIDRLVDTQNADFRIIGLGAASGFYKNSISASADMFSSTLVNATMPVSEFISFENVYFQGSAANLGAYVLDGEKFLRTKFTNCRFQLMNLLTSSIYVQSIYLMNCSVRGQYGGANGIFFNSLGSYDISYIGNLFENCSTIFKSLDSTESTIGYRFIGNLCEGLLSGAPIIAGKINGMAITGNYFENNGGATDAQIDFSQNTEVNSGISITGNRFNLTAGQIANPTAAIKWGHTNVATSSGNYSSGDLHDIADIIAHGYTSGFSSFGEVRGTSLDATGWGASLPRVKFGYNIFGGQINLLNLPTSSAGLVKGDVYNDSGTLKVVLS